MMRMMLSVLLAGVFSAVAFAGEESPSPVVKSRVAIASQPAGATVIVDGAERGITPITICDLKPGRHHLKYRLHGYVEKDRFFDTNEGPYLEKSETLVEEKGLLLLQTEPEGCNIAIDGMSYGQTPRLITNLAAKDTYEVKFTHAGYLPLQIKVKFNGRDPLVRKETLVLDSGIVQVNSDPAGAEVTVNGIVRGLSPVIVKDVPKGQTLVKLTKEGFKEETRELTLRAGDQQTLTVAMEALPGTMHLVSVPDGARFYINDEARGEGPITITGLKPGNYEVRVEKKGFSALTRTVTIESGKPAREEFVLDSVMGRLEVRSSPPGATVIFDGNVLGITKGEKNAELSNVFVISDIVAGEHTLSLRKDGYQESVRHPKIASSKTSRANVHLTKVFVPDIEIETIHRTVRGVLVSESADEVIIETKPGVEQGIPRSEIRKQRRIGRKK